MIGAEGPGEKISESAVSGQRQRVTYASAGSNPGWLTFWMSLAAIDAEINAELRSWLKDMIEAGDHQHFVTHDQDEAIEVADEIIITNRS